jgi:hypothetical protein
MLLCFGFTQFLFGSILTFVLNLKEGSFGGLCEGMIDRTFGVDEETFHRCGQIS